jgi:hypothetical protein
MRPKGSQGSLHEVQQGWLRSASVSQGVLDGVMGLEAATHKSVKCTGPSPAAFGQPLGSHGLICVCEPSHELVLLACHLPAWRFSSKLREKQRSGLPGVHTEVVFGDSSRVGFYTSLLFVPPQNNLENPARRLPTDQVCQRLVGATPSDLF